MEACPTPIPNPITSPLPSLHTSIPLPVLASSSIPLSPPAPYPPPVPPHRVSPSPVPPDPPPVASFPHAPLSSPPVIPQSSPNPLPLSSLHVQLPNPLPLSSSPTITQPSPNPLPLTSLHVQQPLPPPSASGVPSLPPLNWAALFKSKPKNAGKYLPRHFDLVYKGFPLEVPAEVRAAGDDYWKRHLVGFFLDANLSYTAVATHVKRSWRLMGEVKIRSDNVNFYFEFSNDSDRQNVLEDDTMFIKGKMFIITTWNPSFAMAQAQVKSVPIWVHFYKISLLTWTLVGINWLACHLGRLICFNEATEKLTHLEYAKCLIEIMPDKELPDYIAVGDNESEQVYVRLEYDWKPLICTTCCLFGRATLNCDHLEQTNHSAFPVFHQPEHASATNDRPFAQRNLAPLPTGLQASILPNRLSTLTTDFPKPKAKVWQRKHFTSVQLTPPLTALLPVPELSASSMDNCAAVLKTSMHSDSVHAPTTYLSNQFALLHNLDDGELVPSTTNPDVLLVKASSATANHGHLVTASQPSLVSTDFCDSLKHHCTTTTHLPLSAIQQPPLAQATGPTEPQPPPMPSTVLPNEACKQSALELLVHDLNHFTSAPPSNQGQATNDNAFSNLKSYLQNSLPRDQSSLVVTDPPSTTVLP